MQKMKKSRHDSKFIQVTAQKVENCFTNSSWFHPIFNLTLHKEKPREITRFNAFYVVLSLYVFPLCKRMGFCGIELH